MKFKALLLDLDGTLVDTSSDIIAALNHVLVQHQYPKADIQKTKHLISGGAVALLKHCFDSEYFEQHKTKLIEELLTFYAKHTCVGSHLFDGMQTALNLCEEHQIIWGVITNKPYQLSHQLLEQLQLLERCHILIGGDSLDKKKPHPAQLLHSCMQLKLAASECLYIGDDERDIIAGNAAGMDTAVAKWGFISPSEQVENWQADYLLDSPIGLQTLLKEKINGTC